MTDVPQAATVPHVQVVRGAPDDAELAALVAGLVAAASQTDGSEDAPVVADAWTDAARRPSSTRDASWRPGPSAWRWSLHP